MKKIILLSTVALTLILNGCGSDSKSSSTDANTPQTKVSNELKSFAEGFRKSNNIVSTVKGASSAQSETSKTENKNKIYQKDTVETCEDGGTIKITSNIDFDNVKTEELVELISNGITTDITFDDCIEDGTKSNGVISLRLEGKELNKNLITFKNDTTLEDLETTELTTILKDSTIDIEEISDDVDKVTENIKAYSSIKKDYESIDLVSMETYTTDGYSIYEISGKIVQDGITYRVDEQYDSSKTPIISDNNDNVVSGIAKYYDDKNQHIIMTVIDKNQIKISVDTDNDGDIDEEETIDI